jgi:hypothetical protein
MAGDFKNVRVIANGNRKNVPTVNITTTPSAAKTFPKWVQVTGAVALANPGKFETVQDSGGSFRGIPTVHILGYTAPN